jgi:hypothetical protein
MGRVSRDFLYFSRNTFYGGEKFFHRKAVFFILSITPTLLQLLTKTHQISTPIEKHVSTSYTKKNLN